MGLTANSNHFKGTNGARKGLFLDLNIQLFAKFPKNESQIKHILRNAQGHLINNASNRTLLISLSKDKSAYQGRDKNGNDWYSKMVGSKQLWVVVRKGIIQNGGLNDSPIDFISGEGIKKNRIKRRK